MTIIACGIGQPPVGRERGVEERPHAEDGGQGKQNAPITHGKTLPSSGFRFECDCERTNPADNLWQWIPELGARIRRKEDHVISTVNQAIAVRLSSSPPGHGREPGPSRGPSTVGHRRRLSCWRRLGVLEEFRLVRQGQDEVHHVPDHRSVVRSGRHVGAVDSFRNPPVEVDGSATALVDRSIQIRGPDRVAPIVQLLGPDLADSLVELLEALLLLARIAPEDDLVEHVLAHEGGSVALRQGPVAADTVELLLGSTQEQVATVVDALGRRWGCRDRWIDNRCLRRLPLVENALGGLPRVVHREGAHIRLIGDGPQLDQFQLRLSANAQEDDVVDDLFDLVAGHERLEGRHRCAMQAICDRPPQVVSMRPGPEGGRGELEQALAIITRYGIEIRRGRSVTRAGNAVAMQAIPAIKSIAAGNRFAVGTQVSQFAFANLLVAGQTGPAPGQQNTHTLGNNDPIGFLTVELRERITHLVLQPWLSCQAVLALDLLGQSIVFHILHGAREEAVGTAGESGYQAAQSDEQTKTTPHDHAFILPTTGATQPVGTEREPITEGRGKEAGHEVSRRRIKAARCLPKSVRPTRSSCCGRPSGSRWRPKCEGILRSANFAVKAAQAPCKEVILVISYVRYKSLKLFIDFEKNKDYDGVEITRYYLINFEN